jgi:hypothetical protein
MPSPASNSQPPYASSGSSASERYRAWPADVESFSTTRISALKHNFHEHPLMQLPELATLAKSLYPTDQCRFLKPGTTQASAFGHAAHSHDGRDIDDVFRRIEEPGSWVALYNVQTDDRYRVFLDEVISSVMSLAAPEQPGISDIGGFIFISAPPSVTPFHIDRENNFWLQIAGRKRLNVWDHTDRDVVSAAAVEQFVVTGSLADVKLIPGMEARSLEFDTAAGDGVYFPSTSPHMTRSDTDWVSAGDCVSISVGVVFYSDVTRRQANTHALNRILRRAGLSPRSPGDSAFDALKYPLGRATMKVGKMRGRHQPKGF